MKSALLIVLLAAAATAAVVSNEEPYVVEAPDVDEVADVDEIPEVFVTDVDELTVAAELTNEVQEPTQTVVDTRHNLNQGSFGSQDVRVLKGKYKAKGIAGHFLLKTVTVCTNRRISAIRVNRVGSSQGATPSVIEGGIGSSSVILRIRSAVGRGYNYRIQIYVK